jgi:cellulose synthase operon protein C
LGLREQSRYFLTKFTDSLLGELSIAKLLVRPALNRGVYYPAMLKLACGWFYFGHVAEARAALDAARQELFTSTMSPEPKMKLASIYAMTLGHAEPNEAIAGFRELLERLPIHDTPSKIRVVESIALAMSSEDFAADTKTRTWLDEDEYAVRSKIHRDASNPPWKNS